MSNLMELRRANQFDVQQEQMNNPLYQLVQGLGSGFNQGMMDEMEEIKARKDEQRRQENVKKQMANAQQMMQQMAQMGDNSSIGRVNGALDSDQQKRNRNVIKVSNVVPEKSMTMDETGALNLKFGYRQATPQEQKSQFEMQKQQMDMAKEQLLSEGLGAYQNGIITHQQFFNDLVSNGIPIDDKIEEMFTRSTMIREDMMMRKRAQQNQSFQQQPQIPQGFEATEMQRDMMGNLRPAGIKRVQQPTEMDALNAEAKRLDIARTRQDLEPQPLSETERLQQEQMKLGMDKTRQDMAFNAEAQPFRFKQKELSSTQQIQKDKRVSELYEITEINKVKRDQIEQARELSSQIKGGLGGSIERGWMKMADPNNPMLGKWQVIKGVLTDAQLMNTAKTKGAISDKEMALFATAAANDDIASLPRMLPVFDKLMAFMDAEEKAKKESFKKIYREDPNEFLGNDQLKEQNVMQPQPQITREQAIAELKRRGKL